MISWEVRDMISESRDRAGGSEKSKPCVTDPPSSHPHKAHEGDVKGSQKLLSRRITPYPCEGTGITLRDPCKTDVLTN